MAESAVHITEKILKIERQNSLFKWELNGVFIWEIIRYKIYMMGFNESLSVSKNEGPSEYKKKEGFYSKTTREFRKVFLSKNKNPFFDFEQVQTLIFESSRKVLYEKEYIDPYTKFTHDELKSEGLKISTYRPFVDQHGVSPGNERTLNIDQIYFVAALYSRFLSCRFSIAERKRIKEIEKIFYDELFIRCDLESMIRKEINSFRAKYFIFDLILKRKGPEKIFIVNFCEQTALTAAAKKNKITTIEIQHGLISSSDAIYHYPGIVKGSLHYFPDQFYAWSDIWKKVCDLPVTDENVINYGNKYLLNQKSKYSHFKKKEDHILLVSQPGITQAIARAVIDLLPQLSLFHILYKLHPVEYEYSKDIEEIKELRKVKNISFADRQVDLYRIFAESKYVMGVSSTALVEAISFDCRILVLKLPSVEWMTPFIDEKQVRYYSPGLLKKTS